MLHPDPGLSRPSRPAAYLGGPPFGPGGLNSYYISVSIVVVFLPGQASAEARGATVCQTPAGLRFGTKEDSLHSAPRVATPSGLRQGSGRVQGRTEILERLPTETICVENKGHSGFGFQNKPQEPHYLIENKAHFSDPFFCEPPAY